MISNTIARIAADINSATNDDISILYKFFKQGDTLRDIISNIDINSTTFGNFCHWWPWHFNRIVLGFTPLDPYTKEPTSNIRKTDDGSIDFLGRKDNTWLIEQYKFFDKRSLDLKNSDLNALLNEAIALATNDSSRKLIIRLWSFVNLSKQALKWWNERLQKYRRQIFFETVPWEQQVVHYNSLWAHYEQNGCIWINQYQHLPLREHQYLMLQNHGQRMIQLFDNNHLKEFRLLLAWTMQSGKTRAAAELILLLWNHLQLTQSDSTLNIAWLCERVGLIRQLQREMEKYIPYEHLNFCHTTSSDKFKFQKNKINFIASSMSFLDPTNSSAIKDEEIEEEEIKPIEKENVIRLLHSVRFNFLIIDECHIRFAAVKTQTNVKKLKHEAEILLSATPQRSEILDFLKDGEIDYIDEIDILEKKHNLHPHYQNYPEVHNVHFQFDPPNGNEEFFSPSIPGVPNLSILLQPENQKHLRDLVDFLLHVIEEGCYYEDENRTLNINDVIIKCSSTRVVDALVDVFHTLINKRQLNDIFAVKGFCSVAQRRSFVSSSKFDEEITFFLNKENTPAEHRIVIVDRQGIEGFAYGWINCTINLSETKDYKTLMQFRGRGRTSFIYPNGQKKEYVIDADFSQERMIECGLNVATNRCQLLRNSGVSFEHVVGKYHWAKFSKGKCVPYSHDEIVKLGHRVLANQQSGIVRDTISDWSGEETFNYKLKGVSITNEMLVAFLKNKQLDDIDEKYPSKKKVGRSSGTQKKIISGQVTKARKSDTVKFMVVVRIGLVMLIGHAVRDSLNKCNCIRPDGNVDIEILLTNIDPVLVEHNITGILKASGIELTPHEVAEEIKKQYTPSLEFALRSIVNMWRDATNLEMWKIKTEIASIKKNAFSDRNVKQFSEVFTGPNAVKFMKEVIYRTDLDFFKSLKPVVDPFCGAGNLLFGTNESNEPLGVYGCFMNDLPTPDSNKILQNISGGDISKPNYLFTRMLVTDKDDSAKPNIFCGDSFEIFKNVQNVNVVMNPPWNDQLYVPSLFMAANMIQTPVISMEEEEIEDRINYCFSWNPTGVVQASGKGQRTKKLRQYLREHCDIKSVDVFDRNVTFPSVSTPGNTCIFTFSNESFKNDILIVRHDIQGHLDKTFEARVQLSADGTIPLVVGDIGYEILNQCSFGTPLKVYKTDNSFDQRNKVLFDEPNEQHGIVNKVIKSPKEYPSKEINFFYTSLVAGGSVTHDTPFGRLWIPSVKNYGVGCPLQIYNVIYDIKNEFDGCQNPYYAIPESFEDGHRLRRLLLSNITQFNCLQRRANDSVMPDFFSQIYIPNELKTLPIDFSQEQLYEVYRLTPKQQAHLETIVGRSVWEGIE